MATKSDHLSELESLLTGQGLNTPDAEIYGGPLQEQGMADQCITMREQSSSSPDDHFGIGGKAIQHPSVQVMVRGSDRTQAKSDANGVWEILQNADISGYGPTRMPQSGPIYIDTDEDHREKYSVNVELWVYE